MPTWRESLILFQRYLAERGWEPLRPPASEERITALVMWAARTSCHIPDGYVDFLRTTDGFDDFGVLIYSSDAGSRQRDRVSFRDVNEEMHADFPNRTFYGDTGDVMFVYDAETGRYWVQDRPSADLEDSFGTFNELLDHALENEALRIFPRLSDAR